MNYATRTIRQLLAYVANELYTRNLIYKYIGKLRPEMQSIPDKVDFQELFDRLPQSEREEIINVVDRLSRQREQSRYKGLEDVECKKQSLTSELNTIEYEKLENDEWFERQYAHGTLRPSDIGLHHERAQSLFFRRKELIEIKLPAIELEIAAVIKQFEYAESLEEGRRQTDFEHLVWNKSETLRELQQSERATSPKRPQHLYNDSTQSSSSKPQRFINNINEALLEHRRQLESSSRHRRITQLKEMVAARNIPYLVHFTPLNNITSILESGLISRKTLLGRDVIFTDDARADGWLDWISVSITFPNYRMFYLKRNQMISNDISQWAILLLKREIIWELECKFINTNASSFGVRMSSSDMWSSPEAFDAMFSSPNHRLHIPDSYTTDPQAEIMVRDFISKDYITNLVVNSELTKRSLSMLTDLPITVDRSLFAPRCDYEHWKKVGHLNPISFYDYNNYIM